MISPPTPPQLQQDKESVDEQFSRAFALLDQLSTDTTALKAAEDARTERLDAALREVEDVVSELKSSSRRRDDETRRLGDEVRGLKDGIPRAIEGSREGNDKRLRELNSELKSLKVLLGNRLSSSGANASSPTPTDQPKPFQPFRPDQNTDNRNNVNGTTPSDSQAQKSAPASTQMFSAPTPAPRENSKSPFSGLGKPAAIPAWQMAAANKSKEAVVPSNEKQEQQQQDAPAS